MFSDQCLAALGVGSKPGSGLPEGLDAKLLLVGMGKSLHGKLADGRSGAKRALLRYVRIGAGIPPERPIVVYSLC